MNEHGNIRHGHSRRGRKTGTYVAWRSMIARCQLQSQDSYPSYGGRGIKVCREWLSSFEAFHADMGDRPPGMSLDRLDPNGDYERGNVRWATAKEQARNTRNSRFITFKGETLTTAEWAERAGIPSSALRSRIDCLGWDLERALTEPIVPREVSILRAKSKIVAAPIDEYISALEKGESCKEIGERYGVSGSAVAKALQRRGVSAATYTQTTEARRMRASTGQKSPTTERKKAA